MKFQFDRPACQNLRKALRKEWLETNGLGDYASSSLVCCNTRKYHGLFVTELARPAGRHVLLSTLEESLLMAGKEFFFSCRKHPGVYFPARGMNTCRPPLPGSGPLSATVSAM